MNRVASPSASSSYNPGTTDLYGNYDGTSINAASGVWLGRIKSAVSTESCTIDPSGPNSNSSLLCDGPYTDFGLGFHTALPFPANGYSTQLDVYLDVTYAQHHPDCGTASPVGAPCTPNTPGTVNPACTTNPNGINCEGSRFDWNIGLNDPTLGNEIGPEFVFQVGTAPDPSYGGFKSCTGYVVNVGYNSDRSGGNPYNPGLEPKCISASGWYTFKDVFKDDGTGHLEVDFSIADSTGNVNVCQDTNGNPVACTWVRLPGNALTGVGCPRFGWFPNEEINDLPIDNTVFNAAPGACLRTAPQITPTNTTCQQFTSGSAATISQIQYTLKGGRINSVSPGVFFYYTGVTGAQGDQVGISQQSVTPPGSIAIQKLQAILYSPSCVKLGLLTVNSDGTATGKLPSSGTFIIGVKYTPSSLKGQEPPTGGTATYTFDTSKNETELTTATIDLGPK